MEREVSTTTKEIGTNTNNPQIGLFNLKEKKKPHNVQIKNFNPNEPKIKQSIKYSAKQSYRRYKTIKEPFLHSKIMIDDNDEIVSKIQEALGIKPQAKRNYTYSITHANPHNQGYDYMPTSSGKDDDFIERILRDIAITGKRKIDSKELTEEEADNWASTVLRGHSISYDEAERVGDKVQKRNQTEMERKVKALKEKIQKEGSHLKI